jgi:glycosyltransferase involved in cell wall biosynthesis
MAEAKNYPRVTIGITTFDRFDMLIETINSVQNQTFSDVRVLIANDNPERKLDTKSLGISDDSRFIVINHDSNLGEIQTLNSLLGLAETEYFTWLSDDDLLHPLFLQEALKELDCNAEAVVFYSSYFADTQWQPELVEIDHNLNAQIFDKRTFLPDFASGKIQLIGCYGVFRKQSILDAGGIPQLGTGFSPYADTILPILISAQGKVLYTDAKYVLFRTHEESLSNSSQELVSYTSAQKDFLTLISPVLSKTLEMNSYKIRRDFFNWFSSDRAAVIGRNPGLFLPLLTQVRQDMVFLNRLEISFFKKLFLLPSILGRLHMTYRALIKAKIYGLRS